MQVDVFSATPYLGNPVAVVLDGTDLTGQEMQRLARWRTCSKLCSSFLLPPRRLTTGCGSSPPAVSCHSPGTRPWGPHARAWTTAAHHSTPAASCRSAARA
jgi:hypothetical protein